MPKYTDRVYNNAQPIRHLLKGRQDLKMSQVIWELGLRDRMQEVKRVQKEDVKIVRKAKTKESTLVR
jgi:hypothetical protein